MPEEIRREGRLISEQAASLGAAAALRPFVSALRNHWLLIGALTLLAGVSCIAWFQQKPPTWEAQARILVSPLPEDSAAFVGLPILRSADDPGRLITTAADIIESPEAAAAAAAELGDTDRGGVERAVEVSADEASNIVTVAATSKDRERSAELANAYAEASLAARGAALEPLYRQALREVRAQIEAVTAAGEVPSEAARRAQAELQVAQASGADPTLALAQAAVPPGKPLGLPRWVLIIIAFAGGFAIGSMAAVLIDLLTPRRLAEESEVLEILPAPVLTRIPEAGRGVPLGQLVGEIRESYRTLRGRLLYARPGGRSHGSGGSGLGSVAIISPSRGDGRTTSTLNLARAVAAGGERVVAVDLDLRNPGLAGATGHTPKRDLGAVLTDGADPRPAIEPINSELSLLAAPPEAFGAMIEGTAGRIGAIIEAALARAPSVIIDTPAFDEASDALSTIAEVGSIVIVVRLGQTTASGLARLREALDAAGIRPTGYALIGAAPTPAASTRARSASRPRQPA